MIAAGLGQGILGFMLYLVAVALLLRLRFRAGPAAVVLAAAIALWLLTLAGLVAAGQQVNFWVFSTTYWFLALWFLMAFGAIHKSISLRIVAHLAATRSRSATYGDLQRQVLEPSYRERLGIIEDRRYADRVNDRFVLTRAGTRLACCAHGLQGIFGITRSG